MNKEHFKNQNTEDLLTKALSKFDREEVFFTDNLEQKTILEICIDMYDIVKNNSFDISRDIVLCGFRMADNRCEPIFHELSKKYNGDIIDDISLYTLVGIFIQENNIPTPEDIKKTILYDAVFGSGELFYNMTYV